MRDTRDLTGRSFSRTSDPLPAFGSPGGGLGAPPSVPLPSSRAISVAPGDSFYVRRGKRLLDVSVSLVALLVLLPLFPLIALAICLETGLPAIYRSVRLGEGERPFTFFKFRSMVRGAHDRAHEFRHLNQVSGPVFKSAFDPRITRIGRFLRRTSLDELPQLLNVVKGDMSLVGPRPPLPEEVDLYEPWQRARLEVKPGITCLWQVSGRSKLGFEEWMRLDIQYIRNISFLLDLQILLRTLPAVLSREGAY